MKTYKIWGRFREQKIHGWASNFVSEVCQHMARIPKREDRGKKIEAKQAPAA